MPIQVLVVTAAYPSPSEPTRAVFLETHLRELAALPDACGGRRFAVAVLAPQVTGADPLRETREGLAVRRFRYPSGGRRLKESPRVPWLRLVAYLAAGLLATVRLLRETRPALVYAHWVLPTGLIAVLGALATGVPCVLHAHGSDIHRYGVASRLSRRLVRWTVGHASAVLVSCDDLRLRLERDFGLRPSRLARVPMGVDARHFYPGDRAAERSVLRLDDESIELLYVGDLAEEKGIGGLAEAVARRAGVRNADASPRLRLNIAGGGALRPTLEALASAAPAALRLLGRLDPAALARWYRASDLLVLPSKGEGAPVCVQEALSSGLPVVATDVGGVGELVRDGVDGWLVPHGAGADAFLSRVEEIARDRRSLDTVRARLVAAPEDRSAARRAGETAAMLEEVAGEHRAS